MALVAIGGYGRGELNPYSDIDIMFLHDGSMPSSAIEDIAQKLLYFLWDMRLDVGYSVRVIADCVEMAAADGTVKTALMDARYLSGSRPLYSALHKTIFTQILPKSSDKFIKQLACNYPIVERKRSRADGLIRLVSLTGDDNGIVWFCFREGDPNCLPAIGNNGVMGAFQAFLNFCDDRHRIFGTRVVGGHDSEVSEGGRRSPDRRLRIGYLSADFRAHPVAFLMAELTEVKIDNDRATAKAGTFGTFAFDHIEDGWFLHPASTCEDP